MTITAQSIIRRVVETLQDSASIRWPAQELVRYLNDAQRFVVRFKPNALTMTASVALAAGPKQSLLGHSLSPQPFRLIEVVRNTSNTKGAVTLTSRAMLDAVAPDWYSEPKAFQIKHYMVDERDPLVFYVYPPASTNASLEVVYSGYPADVAEPTDGAATWASVTGSISLPDEYAEDLLNYILFRAYSKDAEHNPGGSQSYLSLLALSLGSAAASEAQASPRD